MKLYIDSGSHAPTDEEFRKRKNSLKNNMGVPDVVFTENSTDNSIRKVVGAIPKYPITIIGLLTELFFIKVANILRDSDSEIIDYIQDEFGSKRMPSDKSKIELLDGGCQLHLAANWLIILLSGMGVIDHVFLKYLKMNLTAIIFLLFFASLSLSLTFVAGVHGSRNYHITRTIAEKSSEYTEGCLVVGEEHHEPVGKLLERCDGITVVNPTPED